MWVRAVATAVAVWCVSGAAMAAGYAEVWNPPEATGHAAKHAKKTADGPKAKSATGAKAAPKHVANSQHAAQRVALASKNGAKPAHGSVKKVTGKGVVNGVAKGADKGAAKGSLKGAVKPKPAFVVQARKSRPQIAQAKAGQSRTVHAAVAQGTAHPRAIKVAAKTDTAKPAVSTVSQANVTTNPALASSGSLPPILH
ncbi:hypothetical protein [Paraburkholderia lacunae]|uniref:Transcriptional regulator n=1 Tax=Paraburkholderia lacunae TaxID=2211104 RepID=A0A370N3G7_9BURK|nr:hypothetical protein [Paraburkholderia lacunae]RDK00173.1 hypothetical protein DLM46_24590 [Paraburkholderia lacunae]